jgi:hypothetical protein
MRTPLAVVAVVLVLACVPRAGSADCQSQADAVKQSCQADCQKRKNPSRRRQCEGSCPSKGTTVLNNCQSDQQASNSGRVPPTPAPASPGQARKGHRGYPSH